MNEPFIPRFSRSVNTPLPPPPSIFTTSAFLTVWLKRPASHVAWSRTHTSSPLSSSRPSGFLHESNTTPALIAGSWGSSLSHFCKYLFGIFSVAACVEATPPPSHCLPPAWNTCVKWGGQLDRRTMYAQLDTYTSHKVPLSSHSSWLCCVFTPLHLCANRSFCRLTFQSLWQMRHGGKERWELASDAGRFRLTKQPHTSDSVRFANNAAISHQNNMTCVIKRGQSQSGRIFQDLKA